MKSCSSKFNTNQKQKNQPYYNIIDKQITTNQKQKNQPYNNIIDKLIEQI